MKKNRSTSSICIFTLFGLLITMLGITVYLYCSTLDPLLLKLGFLYTVLGVLWLFLLIILLRRRLIYFTDDLCQTLDAMMNSPNVTGSDPDSDRSSERTSMAEQFRQTNSKRMQTIIQNQSSKRPLDKTPDEETLFARLHHRLIRLYGIMEENQCRVAAERQELQTLVSDISHQVKTPVSNLKMLTDTLLLKNVPPKEQIEFLQGIQSQTEKLDFLFGMMVKSSRLETGMLRFACTNSRIYDTLAQALSGIIYSAEQKNIAVLIQCPENIFLSHDSKWTAEALFNLLDNAVKYTPNGGRITITAEEWELFVKLSVCDTGRGIAETSQAAVFRRFYREEEVHDIPGVGIGLYLTREIITLQGGYLKLTSVPGQGSTFSIFLPKQ